MPWTKKENDKTSLMGGKEREFEVGHLELVLYV